MQGNPQLFAAVRASSVPPQRRAKSTPAARSTTPSTDSVTAEPTATRRRASVPSTLMAMMVAASRKPSSS